MHVEPDRLPDVGVELEAVEEIEQRVRPPALVLDVVGRRPGVDVADRQHLDLPRLDAVSIWPVQVANGDADVPERIGGGDRGVAQNELHPLALVGRQLDPHGAADLAGERQLPGIAEDLRHPVGPAIPPAAVACLHGEPVLPRANNEPRQPASDPPHLSRPAPGSRLVPVRGDPRPLLREPAELPFDLAQVGADVVGPRLLLDAADEPGNAVREPAHVPKVPGFDADVVEVDFDFSRGIGEEETQLVEGEDVIEVDPQVLPALLQDDLFEPGVVAEADPQVHGALGRVECLEDQVPVRGPVPHRKLSLR